MSKLTNQSAFDIVAAHLLKQDCKSLAQSTGNTVPGCAYRGINNTRCSIGALIPDESYHPKYEGRGVTANLQDYPEFAALFDGVNQGLLSALQIVHDYQQPKDWRSELERLAIRFQLSPSVVTNEEKCESCGTTENVTFAPDPYDEDINGDDTPVHLCEHCREERAADI